MMENKHCFQICRLSTKLLHLHVTSVKYLSNCNNCICIKFFTNSLWLSPVHQCPNMDYTNKNKAGRKKDYLSGCHLVVIKSLIYNHLYFRYSNGDFIAAHLKCLMSQVILVLIAGIKSGSFHNLFLSICKTVIKINPFNNVVKILFYL